MRELMSVCGGDEDEAFYIWLQEAVLEMTSKEDLELPLEGGAGKCWSPVEALEEDERLFGPWYLRAMHPLVGPRTRKRCREVGEAAAAEAAAGGPQKRTASDVAPGGEPPVHPYRKWWLNQPHKEHQPW